MASVHLHVLKLYKWGILFLIPEMSEYKLKYYDGLI